MSGANPGLGEQPHPPNRPTDPPGPPDEHPDPPNRPVDPPGPPDERPPNPPKPPPGRKVG